MRQNLEFDAGDWMYAIVDDPCTDNYRFAFYEDKDAMIDYQIQVNDGCCGFFDQDILIAGKEATIGCNYGH